MHAIYRSLLYVIVLCLSTSFAPNPVDEAVYHYVDTYQDLAVVEMYRSGVPASITLAQALHESGMGQSDLAVFANNHFGIKCKSYWTGKTYRHKDDDYDEQGNLIKSCFRSYDTVIDSYIDHSNFLNQSAHYQELFDLPRTDYRQWAHGLKRCGYATDPAYADKLIAKIEKYQLYIYDSYQNPLHR